MPPLSMHYCPAMLVPHSLPHPFFEAHKVVRHTILDAHPQLTPTRDPGPVQSGYVCGVVGTYASYLARRKDYIECGERCSDSPWRWHPSQLEHR